MTEPDETIPEPDTEEPQEPVVAPQEPSEEEIEEEEREEQATPEEPAEPGASALSEKEMEKAQKRIEGENTRHSNRISEIMGEDANALEPCPLCSHFVSGFVFPVVPPEEIIVKVRAAIGLPDLSNYQQAKHARRCEDCAGLGVVLSGSLVSGNQAISCPACKGSGYIVQPALGEPFQPPAPSNGQQQGEPMVGVNPDDPAVAELRARGFTVFPPIATPAGP